MNLIVDLSIYISSCLIIALLLIMGFIGLTLLVTALVTRLASFTSTLGLICINELLIVVRNLLLIFIVRESTDALIGCITIEIRIKNWVSNIECTLFAQGVTGSVS